VFWGVFCKRTLTLIHRIISLTRKLGYRKNDRAMRPI